MLNASGVTQGHVVRPSDLETPRRIAFIQCVGARGEGGRPYCSRFCCMNAVKDSMLIRQHDPEVEEISILYTDPRAFGKGFDDFVARSKEQESAVYLRGRPAKVPQPRGRQPGDLCRGHPQPRADPGPGRSGGAVGRCSAKRRRHQARRDPRHRDRPKRFHRPPRPRHLGGGILPARDLCLRQRGRTAGDPGLCGPGLGDRGARAALPLPVTA